jgi:hypothetical protein
MTMLIAKLDQAAHDGVAAEQVRAGLAAAEPGLHALMEVASRRSLRVRSLSGGEQRVMELLGGPSDRQTVA